MCVFFLCLAVYGVIILYLTSWYYDHKVDDASTMGPVKDELDAYMAQYPKVKIVRAPERVGLIRARLSMWHLQLFIAKYRIKSHNSRTKFG